MEQTTIRNKWKRLSLAKAEFPAILKDTQAYGYQYAKLEQVINAVEPILHKHDLDLLQTVIDGSVKTYIVDLITGEKELVGDIVVDTSVVLAKMNPFQVMGSAISYFRRYEILAGLGLAQEDNDAQGEVVKPQQHTYEVITMQKLKELYLVKKQIAESTDKDRCNKITDYFLNNNKDFPINSAFTWLKGL